MPKRQRSESAGEREKQERIRKALDMISDYALIDGAHHKNWVIVEVAKALCGSTEDYEKFVKDFEYDDEGETQNGWLNMIEECCTPP